MTLGYDISTKGDNRVLKKYIEGRDGDLFIMIQYQAEEYEEIINLRKFDVESLFSQVGGFIGIMLGISLFHIPDILTNIITATETACKKTSKMKDVHPIKPQELFGKSTSKNVSYVSKCILFILRKVF